MIFNERNVTPAICFLVLCIACSELKVHTGDTQDQTSSRPNTLFDDADDIQRQLDNEARDRFKYGRPKAIWILNIPTHIPLMTNSLDWVHRRPRNPVTYATWRNIFDSKSKSKKNYDIEVEPKTEYFIQPELNYKTDAGPAPNNDKFLAPESNNINIEPEQTIEYDLKNGNDNNNDSGPSSELKNLMELGTDDMIDIKDSDSETGTEDINKLEQPLDAQNSLDPGANVTDDKELDNRDYDTGADNNNVVEPLLDVTHSMDPGSDYGNDMKQGPDNPEYETGIDVDNDLGPSLDVKNSMEPDITVKQGPSNPFYTVGTGDYISSWPPLDVNNAIESESNVKNDEKQVPDDPDSATRYTPSQSAEKQNYLGQAHNDKTINKSGPNINNDSNQAPDIKDSTIGSEENIQGQSLDLENGKETVPEVNSDVKQGPDISDSGTQSAEVNNNLGPVLDRTNVKEVEPDVNNEVKQGSDNLSDDKDGGILGGSLSSWSYKEQDKWVKDFPSCGLHSQSPVDLPSKGLVGARGARSLTFINYDVMPLQLRLKSDGNSVTLSGDWEDDKRPLIYGGAGHSRRYRFHCLTLHAPSEHTLEKLLFPLETQVLHVSTDYATFDDAVKGSTKDHLAFLGIVNIYKYGCRTEPALKQLLKVASAATRSSGEVRVNNAPLSAFSPPFGEYACYHGSLTTPPCTEAVLWLVRGKALPLEREFASTIKMAAGNRVVQPLNDRRVILFNKK